jgi:hypothetical protein
MTRNRVDVNGAEPVLPSTFEPTKRYAERRGAVGAMLGARVMAAAAARLVVTPPIVDAPCAGGS